MSWAARRAAPYQGVDEEAVVISTSRDGMSLR